MKRIRRKLTERLDQDEMLAFVQDASKLLDAKSFDDADLVLTNAEIRLAEVRRGSERAWWERELELRRACVTHRRGEYEKSAELFAALLPHLPQDEARYWTSQEWLGHAEWHCRRYDTAYKRLVKVAAGSPNPDERARALDALPNIRHQKAVALSKEGRHEEAIREAKALLSEKPGEPLRSQLVLFLGRVYALPEVKRYVEACELLESVMASATEANERASAKLWWQFARCQMAGLDVEAGKYDVALTQLDALLAEGIEGQGRHGVLMWKAAALRRSGEYRAAERCWVEVLRSDDVDPKMRADATEYLERLRREHL